MKSLSALVNSPSPKAPEPAPWLAVQALEGAGGSSLGSGRLAAIDVGSNSIHMIVVAPDSDGSYRVVDREKEMVRLGRSALSRGSLSERAVEEGLLTLTKMTTLARLKEADRVVAVATSAVREAENGEEFLERVRAQTGIEVQRLSGEEEGRMIYRAVREAVELGEGWAVIADIGGGSTEWITTQGGEIREVMSLRLGSLRLASRLKGDPTQPASLSALRRKVRRRLEDLPTPKKVATFVATSGTATCCADLAEDLAGRRGASPATGLRQLKTKELGEIIRHLSSLRQSEIAELPSVGALRAESILSGAVLLHEIALHAGVDRVQVSDRALREGLVLEVLGRPLAALPEPGAVRREQVEKLAQRCATAYEHALHCSRLAVRLFDLTQSLHSLGPREREWLEHAALLHDLGYLVDYRQHHKHSFYLINHAALTAFDRREIEVIAYVARYHRGAAPSKSHPDFAQLRPWQRRTVRRLAALLRVADALDRSHAQRVSRFTCSISKGKVRLEVVSAHDVELELDSVRDRRRLFERIFGRKLRALQVPGSDRRKG